MVRSIEDGSDQVDMRTKRHGLKHAVECNCILPQYKGVVPPVFHRFVVFTVIDTDDSAVPKYVTCNNCGATHRVFEIGRSEVVSDENTSLVRSIDDVALGLPDRLSALLRAHDVPFPTWEECEFVLKDRAPRATVIITRETDGNKVRGKALRINGKDRFEIEQYETSVSF